MQVNVSVQLSGKEKVVDANAAAAAVLRAMGGDPEKDTCYVHVQTVQDPGRAGPELESLSE